MAESPESEPDVAFTASCFEANVLEEEVNTGSIVLAKQNEEDSWRTDGQTAATLTNDGSGTVAAVSEPWTANGTPPTDGGPLHGADDVEVSCDAAPQVLDSDRDELTLEEYPDTTSEEENAASGSELSEADSDEEVSPGSRKE